MSVVKKNLAKPWILGFLAQSFIFFKVLRSKNEFLDIRYVRYYIKDIGWIMMKIYSFYRTYLTSCEICAELTRKISERCNWLLVTVTDYRAVSLLPICGKILEKLIFDNTFQFFITNKLIAANQSGFKPGDSWINQLLSITHDIHKSFNEGYQVKRMFLDISKALDKVWHKGIIFRLKQNSISGNLLEILADRKIESRGLYWMDKFPTGQMLPSEFPKDSF